MHAGIHSSEFQCFKISVKVYQTLMVWGKKELKLWMRLSGLPNTCEERYSKSPTDNRKDNQTEPKRVRTEELRILQKGQVNMEV